MRVSWRNLDWLGEADRGEIEKKLAEIGGDSSLLDRVDFLAREPAQAGAPFEVRISGNVAKNQITAVRREATSEAAFRSALEAFERSAMSVWSARSAAPTKPPVPALVPVASLPARRAQPGVEAVPALVSRWRPDLSLPRLNLSLDPQALFERLAQPTRGAWRAASSLLPQPSVLLRRALARQSQRSLDQRRAEALERMSWRERLATLAMWNEMEAAERWAREQVFQRRYRSELERGERRIEASSGWRERIADLALWNELEAAERWAREQVMARLRGRGREVSGANAPQLPGRAAPGWRARLADLSVWDTLEALELRLRSRGQASRDPRSAGAGLFAQVSRSLRAAGGLLQAPLPVRAVGAFCVAGFVGLWAFQGVSNTENMAQASLLAAYSQPAPSDPAYSAVAVPMSWAGIEAPFSAVAVPQDPEDDAPFSALAVPFTGVDVASGAAAEQGLAFSAVALPEVSVAAGSLLDDDRAALRD